MPPADTYFDERQYLRELIELAHLLPQPKILYSASILLDDGEFFGELSLLDSSMEMVVERQSQTGCKRRYVWSYEDIENVEHDSVSVYELNLSLKAGVLRRDRPLNLNFEFTSQRDRFAFRLKILAKLYGRK